MPLLFPNFGGSLGGGGGGSTYETESQAIFDAFTTTPTDTRKDQIDAAVQHLLSGPLSGSDIWSKLDMLQVYKAADQQAARVDWIDPTRVASAVNSPTFTADVGFSTNGSDSEIDTLFNPGDGGTYSFLRNSASFGFWQGAAATTGSAVGWYDGSDGITIQHRGASNDDAGFRINQAGGSTIIDGGLPSGDYLGIANRSGASATEWYKDGIEQSVDGSPDQSSTAINNHSLRVGRITSSGYTAVDAKLIFAGGSLGADEAADLFNAVLGYDEGVDAGKALCAEASTLHAVRNAWDSAGRHFVVVGSEELWRSTDGGETYSKLYTFPDSPTIIYGLFIDSNDNVFVSPQGQSTGINGRVYRSTDNGATFSEISTFDAGWHSGHIAFWGMAEDASGNLYCGQYNTFPTKETKCKVWKSADAGLNWTDISDANWSTNDHVHGLGIDAANGWLYATIGDSTGGIWRSKLLDGTDWVRKTGAIGANAEYSFIPLEFDGTNVYAGDDETDAAIWTFADDGTGDTQSPSLALNDPETHNVYYLKRDPSGRFWCCMPPSDATASNVVGVIYTSTDGSTWTKIYQAPPEAYADWLNGASSLWTLHTGTTQWGNQTGGESLFPLNNFNGLKVSVA